MADIIGALRGILDPMPAALLTEPGDIAPYARDWLGKREGRPMAVARPSNAEQVAAIVRLCAAGGVPLVPQGGNTGLLGGGTPDGSGRQLLLSLSRMNRIRSVDPVGDIVVAEAGCTLAMVKEAVGAHRRILPFGIGSDGTAQVGGVLSTNAGGHMALRYGVARDLVLGLEAVLPDGTLLAGPRPLRKDNTGFDAARLLIGAEGSLGLITAAALRLVPAPLESATALVSVPDVESAIALLVRLREGAGARLAAFELILPAAMRMAMDHAPAGAPRVESGYGAYALVELDDVVPGPALRVLMETLLEAALNEGLAADAVLAESLEQRRAIWGLRESFPELQGRLGLSLKHDIALPLAALPAFIKECEAELAARFPELTVIAFGHAGDGNLHWNVQAPGRTLPDQEAVAQAVRTCVYDVVAAHGGAFSAEHGVGRAYLDHVRTRVAPGRVKAMQALKAALDPLNIMNPGAVVPA